MSTVYNRRRGNKAHQIRAPRLCRHMEPHVREDKQGIDLRQCPRFAPRNRYCDEHQAVKRA